MAANAPQWQHIAQVLADSIESGDLRPGDRVPIETEIAARFGVSRPTAHRALADLQRQGLVTRQRRNGTVVASRIVEGTHLIGLIVDRFASAFDFPQSELIHGIQEVIGEDYSLVWCDAMDDPQREAHFLRKMAKQSDGIILFPMADPANTGLLRQLQRSQVPLVLLDRVPEGFAGPAVISDDREVTRQSILELGERGHRRIGFLGFYKPNVSSARGRYDTYLEAMRALGVEDPSPFVRWFPRQLELEPDLLEQCMRDTLFALLKGPEPVTAIYCIQDSFAAEVTKEAQRLGVRIGHDLEVVTVHEWPERMLPEADRMHRIVRRKREIGNQTARTLLSLIRGEQVEPGIHRVPAELHPAPLTEFLTASRTTNGG